MINQLTRLREILSLQRRQVVLLSIPYFTEQPHGGDASDRWDDVKGLRRCRRTTGASGVDGDETVPSKRLRSLLLRLGRTDREIYQTSLDFKLDHSAADRHIFCSHFTVNLTQQTLDTDTVQLLDLGLKFVPTITLLEFKETVDDERCLLRRIALYDFWSNNPRENENNNNNDRNDFPRKFTSRSAWTPATHQITDFTVKTMNKICETICNIMAGKLHTKNYTQYIKAAKKIYFYRRFAPLKTLNEIPTRLLNQLIKAGR